MFVGTKLKVVKAVLLATILFISSIGAHAVPVPPVPQRLVNDFAGILSSKEIHSLEQRLVAYDDTTSTQIAVVIVPDLEGMDAAQYATEIGEEWGVGSGESNNGVVVLVKPKNDNGSGEVFIAVGYGLEGAIPDARVKRIINNVMIPRFVENDYYGAIAGACEALIKLADGEEFEQYGNSGSGEVRFYLTIVITILILILLAKLSRKGGGGTSGNGPGGNTRHRPRMPYTHYGWGGNSGSRGGFGGFGGGSFGGGGAGGKW
ncbi:MAG: TPM domain-containing protein [Bacteroidales bacterium]|nr:TPM domain-containing protein [Bacteroidales bacterium]